MSNMRCSILSLLLIYQNFVMCRPATIDMQFIVRYFSETQKNFNSKIKKNSSDFLCLSTQQNYFKLSQNYCICQCCIISSITRPLDSFISIASSKLCICTEANNNWLSTPKTFKTLKTEKHF